MFILSLMSTRCLVTDHHLFDPCPCFVSYLSSACHGGGWISERCDLSGKLLWLRMAARSQVHTNTSSRPAGRFLQRLSFQQTEFQCEPPPLQRRLLTQGNTIQADTGIHEQAAGISGKHYRMHQTSTLERSCWSN